MAKFIKNPKILIFIILLSIPSISFFSYAQTPTPARLLVNWPESPLRHKLDENSKLTDLVQYLYEWGIGLGGLFLFIIDNFSLINSHFNCKKYLHYREYYF